MTLLERLQKIRNKLAIVVAVLFGLMVLLVVGIVVSGLLINRWESHKILKNQVGIEFISIPAGSFMMGSETGNDDEKPVHQVNISRAFLMGRYEVTSAQWKAVMGKDPQNFKADSLPAQFVSWNEAQEFIRRMNQKNDGYTYRLPTEAEWEYACHAGTKSDDLEHPDWLGWYDQNSDNRVHPVGEKHANDWGLYDMQGNVSEWCQDWYDKDFYGHSPSADPQGPSTGQEHVKRGGSRYDNRSLVRSTARQGGRPEELLDTNGFRVVAVAHPK